MSPDTQKNIIMAMMVVVVILAFVQVKKYLDDDDAKPPSPYSLNPHYHTTGGVDSGSNNPGTP